MTPVDMNSGLRNDPVGSGSREVRPGECIESIAASCGHFWEKIWNHEANSELKRTREDPNALLVGDRVEIPEIETKDESKATERRHRFRRKGVPSKLKVRILDDWEPRKHAKYRLVIDGTITEGKTDGDGFVEEGLPPDASQGELIIDREDGGTDHYRFDFGTVSPIDTEAGVKRRLQDMGYDTEDLEKAVSGFQQDQGLEESGTMDDETKSKLQEVFGQ